VVLAGIGLIAAGLFVQAALVNVLPGILLVLLGNALLLVKGLDNRVELGKFHAEANWQRIDKAKLDEIPAIHKRMRTWDRSLFDPTNPAGGFAFGGMVLCLWTLWQASGEFESPVLRIFVYNALALLLPHWLTGIKRTMTAPDAVLRAKLFSQLLDRNKTALDGREIEYYSLLKGDKAKIPQDLKIRVKLPNQPDGFLGLYGQIVLNSVSSSVYPYFYTVLVAKKGFGLDRLKNENAGSGCVIESKMQDGVEVLVLRQTTTKTSGYHTNNRTMDGILRRGIELAGTVCGVG